MKTYTAIIEKCPDTGLYIGYVPNFPGAHTQAKTLDELNHNLKEVIEMLLVVSILETLGFIEVRQRGSHKQFRHPDGKCTPFPCKKRRTGMDIPSRGENQKVLP